MMSPIRFLAVLFILILFAAGCQPPTEKRETISLNGQWQVTASSDSIPPSEYERTIQVPGLIDLAEPAFPDVAYTYADQGRENTGDPDYQYDYFWYRKNIFIPAEKSEIALLKVHKAKFGHTVFVNGANAGSYNFCFTPGYHNIGSLLNYGEENEIVIRVGASPEALPDTIPFGFEIEKALYFSGIYDYVELFLADYPFIENIQVVPDIDSGSARAILYLENGGKQTSAPVDYRIYEQGGNAPVAEGSVDVSLRPGEKREVEVELDIPGPRLWSPEDPFLYEFEAVTPGDSRKVTFGMREFRFDPETRLAYLNNEPYYLRGTNIAMHRFFEDSLRGSLPWQNEWIEKMHNEFKEMHWNSYRFHVGFAPEAWYETADEIGFLVQDEYAIWGIYMEDTTKYSTMQHKRLAAGTLATEYRAWMKERWNHPSVVIWDAQNETVWRETGKAIAMVRNLDASNRPWDNGFSPPVDESDMIESHPYLFAHYKNQEFTKDREWPEGGLLQHDLAAHPEPFNDPNKHAPPAEGKKFDNPVIVNEYGWIWLYRDGTPASVAEKIWSFYPEFDTPEKRWDWRGRVIAAKTEYWRSRRDVAGVQHFCILTCERTHGQRTQVSDEWKDVENLVMQPGFKKHVKHAFSPVGLFIDWFKRSVTPGSSAEIPFAVFNDTGSEWSGNARLSIQGGDSVLVKQEVDGITVAPYGKTERLLSVDFPQTPGRYELLLEITFNGEPVISSRLFNIE